ncbi:MAG: hypothetical protein ACI4JZ_01755 [Oscillospiraceae bacterium]
MENKIKALFELQRFSGNKRLDGMINAAESRYQDELSDEELDFVSAAGSSFPKDRFPKKKTLGNTEKK